MNATASVLELLMCWKIYLLLLYIKLGLVKKFDKPMGKTGFPKMKEGIFGDY